jgi:BirA family biotin operon repressor/biotin-[acetyl-CoA-carboxylase] ligase
LPSLTPIGTPFIELPAVDSTNNYAMGLVREGMAQHGTAVFAHNQWKGKGQRDKSWLSGANQNIAISMIVEPAQLDPSQVFLLSMAAALGAMDFFNRYIADDVKIKWPNDIYWRDRKAAGILIENVWQQNTWKYAVIGIGINVNQTDFENLGKKAVSLKQLTGKHFIPKELAAEVCTYVNQRYHQLLTGSEQVVEDYHAALYLRNATVKFKKANRAFEAVVRGVTHRGELVVEHAIEEKFNVGEVEWLVDEF